MFWFVVAKIYIKIYEWCRTYFGITLKGLGYVQRLIRTDHVLNFEGKKLYFNHHVANCYGLLINGKANEPETHLFLKNIIDALHQPIIFVDVGCNIGEMIVDVGGHRNVSRIIGFEPNEECAKACRKTVGLNNYAHTDIIGKAVNADGKDVNYFSGTNPLAGSIVDDNRAHRQRVPATTLDAELLKFDASAIILIDVEGAEPLVLKGGTQYIAAHHPLIIFEYNDVSRKFFTLDDMRTILGEGYKLYRLRHDGHLDNSFDSTWNCVAVPSGTFFSDHCQSLIVE